MAPRGAKPKAQAARRARLGEAREDVADSGDNGLVGVEADLAIGLAPDKADRQSSAEFTACCLVANAAIEAGPQHVKFGLAHGALEPEQEAIIEEGWMIDPSASPISVSVSPPRSMRRCQSALLRARRETSSPSTRPTWASATSAVRRAKPDLATKPEPESPRSSSMTMMRSLGQPSSRALAASAYCRSVDSRLCSTWAALDWRR